MMDRKWTQGPWLSSQSDTDAMRQAVWADGGMAGASQVCVMTADFRAEMANAHLIAAAPDLYEALEAMLNSFDEVSKGRAYDALAKARGETQ